MTEQRRVAIAVDISMPHPHHQGVDAGTHLYAKEHAAWECVIDEHPGITLRKHGKGPLPYDGVLARATPELADQLDRVGVPLVNVWYQNDQPGLPGVYVDPVKLGELAAEHLMERGFRRLGCLINPDRLYAAMMGRGFESAVKQEGAQCLFHEHEAGNYRDPAYWAGFQQTLNDWLDQFTAPFALFMEAPQDVRIAITLCAARGWRVPQDVAILSQSNIRAVVEHPPPQISSFDLNYERIGYEAAALLDRMMGGEPPPNRPILLPPKGVIARETTDYFAVEDTTVADALRYISAHLSEPLSVDRIAMELAISPRNLQMRFDAALGRSISDEIRRLRLAVAKRLLGDEDFQIGEVSKISGFGQQSYLTQVFRRELGVTPSAYRKQILGEKT